MNQYSKSLINNLLDGGKPADSEKSMDWIIFVSALISGIIAHGYMMTNKIIEGDEVYYAFGLGSTFPSSRWVLGLLDVYGSKFISFFSNPLFNGLLSILFIALTCMVLCRALNIKNRISAVALSVTMVVFPVITGIFLCMFTAPIYQVALLMSVTAMYILKKHVTIRKIVLSSFLIALSLGIYQAYISVSMCVALLILFVLLLNNEEVKDVAKKGLQMVVVGVLGLAEYFLLNKFFMSVYDVTPIDYKGMATIGQLDISRIPALMIHSYKRFFTDPSWNGINTFPVVKIFIFIIAIGTAYLFMTKMKPVLKNKIAAIVVIIVFPLFANSVYLMSTDPGYYVTNLMQYALVMVFCIPAIIYDRVVTEGVSEKCSITKSAVLLLIIGMILVNFTYAYIDNSCYLKATYIQKQADSYYTSLISTIKNTEGYKDEYPVAFIGEFDTQDKTIAPNGRMSTIHITGYLTHSIAVQLSYRPTEYMKLNCGFAPVLLEDTKDIEKSREFKEMPVYPDYGSVKIIDNTVVVKLLPLEEE